MGHFVRPTKKNRQNNHQKNRVFVVQLCASIMVLLSNC